MFIFLSSVILFTFLSLPNLVLATNENYSISEFDKESNSESEDNILGKARGDLDKDGVSEEVIVIELPSNKDSIVENELQIYKKAGNKWLLWHKSRNPINSYPINEPGGNGFSQVTVERGCIVIRHSYSAPNGNSGTDIIQRFRFQNNDWFLIGITNLVHFGCPPWDDDPFITNIKADFNFSTGKGIIKTTYELCDESSENFDSSKTIKLPKPTTSQFSTQAFGSIKMDNHKFSSKELKPKCSKNRTFQF